MKKSVYLTLICAASAMFFCGCSSTNSSEEPPASAAVLGDINAANRAQVISDGKVIGDKVLRALQSGNYSLIADEPIGDGQNVFTQERFDELIKKLQEQGGIASYSFLGDLSMQPYQRLLWKVTFKKSVEKPDTPDMDVLFELIMAEINGSFRAAAFGFRQ